MAVACPDKGLVAESEVFQPRRIDNLVHAAEYNERFSLRSERITIIGQVAASVFPAVVTGDLPIAFLPLVYGSGGNFKFHPGLPRSGQFRQLPGNGQQERRIIAGQGDKSSSLSVDL